MQDMTLEGREEVSLLGILSSWALKLKSTGLGFFFPKKFKKSEKETRHHPLLEQLIFFNCVSGTCGCGCRMLVGQTWKTVQITNLSSVSSFAVLCILGNN